MFPISRGIFRSRFASAIHLTYVLKSSVPLASIFYRNIKRLYSQKPQLYTERHYSCSKDMSSTIYAIPHMLKFFFFLWDGRIEYSMPVTCFLQSSTLLRKFQLFVSLEKCEKRHIKVVAEDICQPLCRWLC